MKIIVFPGNITCNTYIVYSEDLTGESKSNTGRAAVIIDPGTDSRRISRAISELKLKPIAVFLTHGHFDHIYFLNQVKKEYGIPVYIHKDESEFLLNDKLNLFALLPPDTSRVFESADGFFIDSFGNDENYENYDNYENYGNYDNHNNNYADDTTQKNNKYIKTFTFDAIEIKILHTPGHTPGSSCFMLSDAKDAVAVDNIITEENGHTVYTLRNAMFTGDTLFDGAVGRHDFPGGSYENLVASIDRLRNFSKSNDRRTCKIFPGHGGDSTLFAALEEAPF